MALKNSARIRQSYVKKIREDIGMTFDGIAQQTGASRQYAEQVFSGKEAPSVGFMSGLLRAGLASSFDEIAAPVWPRDGESVAQAAERALAA